MDEIGILCGRGREKALAAPLREETVPGAAALVFSLPYVDMAEDSANGLRVADGDILPCRFRLPRVIFNLAVQHSRANIRRMRALTERTGLTLVNQSNELDQRAVMQMLLSGGETAPLVVPFGEAEKTGSAAAARFILRPAAGMDPGRVVYGVQAADGWDLYHWHGTVRCRVPSARVALGPDIRRSGRLLLRVPELTLLSGRPEGTRCWLQRGADGGWRAVAVLELFAPGALPRPAEPGQETPIRIARRVGRFLPDMGLCTVDLLTSASGAPVFLGLGGWTGSILRSRRGRMPSEIFRNMLGYARLLRERSG